MSNNEIIKDCGFSDDIVAYIYDEIDPSRVEKFESHLESCTACTDEFAGISHARFSVFEWNKEAFVHLETPEFVIPYASKKKAAESAGFFAGLVEMLTLSGWSSAVMVAAGLLICIGLGFTVMNFAGRDQQVAEVKKPAITEPIAPSAVNNVQQPVTIAQERPSEQTPNAQKSVAINAKSEPVREIRAERASMQVRRIREKNLTAKVIPEPPAVQPSRKTPALTAYDEDVDKSLRLADLFDEGGSKL